MRRALRSVNWEELGRAVQLYRLRPKPPDEFRYANGLLSWKPPFDTRGITHFRIYADSDGGTFLVRQVPYPQAYLQDNLVAARLFLTSYNARLSLESTPAIIDSPVSPIQSDDHYIRVVDGRNPIAVATNFAGNPHRIRIDADVKIVIVDVSLQVRTAPVGNTLIYDLLRSNDNQQTWASLFPAGNPNKLVLPASQTRVVNSTLAITELFRDEIIRADTLQVGSVTPGANGDIVIKGKLVKL